MEETVETDEYARWWHSFSHIVISYSGGVLWPTTVYTTFGNFAHDSALGTRFEWQERRSRAIVNKRKQKYKNVWNVLEKTGGKRQKYAKFCIIM